MPYTKSKKYYENVYVEPLSKRKCDCEEPYKKAKGNTVYWAYYYENVRRYTFFHFCRECWERKKQRLESCPCPINIISKCYPTLPDWIWIDNKPEINPATGNIL